MWLASTLILHLSIIDIVISTVDYLQHPVKSCHIGDSVENECTKCLCTSKTVFECTALDCNNKTTHNELESTAPLCFPNQLYVQNLITCICTKDGKWPHKSCHDTFQSLPPRNVIVHKCEPDTYIPIDCNVCRCGPDGKIINDRCTRNACEDEVQRRTATSPNTLFSKCEEKCWYSLAPCQFCFCIKQNKLVCNTGSYFTNSLDLGTYKLNICGKELIKEAIELIPDESVLRAESERPAPQTTTIPTPLIEKNSDEASDDGSTNLAIEVGQNKILISPRAQVNTTSSNEYYSDDVEEQTTSQPTLSPPTLPSTTTQTRGEQITVNIPIEDDNEEVGETEVKADENPDDNSKELEVEFIKNSESQGNFRPVSKQNVLLHEQDKDTKVGTYQYDGKTLKISIPTVLKKVFKTAMRKSMVSLSNTTECTTPGAKTMQACNTCFCLKNGKLLCTDHKCTGDKKV